MVSNIHEKQQGYVECPLHPFAKGVMARIHRCALAVSLHQ
jgi:hypothetical protein